MVFSYRILNVKYYIFILIIFIDKLYEVSIYNLGLKKSEKTL